MKRDLELHARFWVSASKDALYALGRKGDLTIAASLVLKTRKDAFLVVGARVLVDLLYKQRTDLSDRHTRKERNRAVVHVDKRDDWYDT